MQDGSVVTVNWMPFGIGTEFIGARDFGTDGSYATTEFKVAGFPLYAIRSVRKSAGDPDVIIVHGRVN